MSKPSPYQDPAVLRQMLVNLGTLIYDQFDLNDIVNHPIRDTVDLYLGLMEPTTEEMEAAKDEPEADGDGC